VRSIAHCRGASAMFYSCRSSPYRLNIDNTRNDAPSTAEDTIEGPLLDYISLNDSRFAKDALETM